MARHRQGPQQPQPNQQPNHHITAHVQQTSWSGPLPAPAALREFDSIVPNGAARIMAMAEAEQTHRIKMESDGQAAAIRETKRTQWLGAGLSLLAMVGAGALSWFTGAVTVPALLLSVPITSVIIALIRSRST